MCTTVTRHKHYLGGQTWYIDLKANGSDMFIYRIVRDNTLCTFVLVCHVPLGITKGCFAMIRHHSLQTAESFFEN